MDLQKFAEDVITLTPYFHVEMLRKLPAMFHREKITFPQMLIVEILRAKKESPMSDMARTLGVTKSAVTAIADRMIKTGLLHRARAKDDRRIVKIAL
ncbi:MAG: MarR family transcriptional regulator, partial [Candidatus Omnitrophota bacterium]